MNLSFAGQAFPRFWSSDGQLVIEDSQREINPQCVEVIPFCDCSASSR